MQMSHVLDARNFDAYDHWIKEQTLQEFVGKKDTDVINTGELWLQKRTPNEHGAL